MEELKNWNQLTQEQQTLAKKALSRSRTGMFLSVAKFLGLLFLSNLATQFLGHHIMQDVDDSTWVGFCLVSSVLNAIFLSLYFRSLMDRNNARLKTELLAITKSNP
jgi:hypothetical protein